MIRGILRRIFSLLSAPTHTIEEGKKIIDSFPEPENDFDRTYYNYICTCWGRKKWNVVLINSICFIAVPFIMILYLMNSICIISKKKQVHDAIIVNADNRLGVHYSYEGRIPSSLYSTYNDVKELQLKRFPEITKGAVGTRAFITWFRFFIRHPFSGFVNLRALINLSGINRLIKLYKPKAIVFSRAELNGMSSLTTLYCESCGVKYINFMHGDSRAELAIAFVRFTEFYIWDRDYIDVFDWGRCAKGQYVVYTPGIYAPIERNDQPKYHILYVFGGNEETGKDKNAVAVRDILMPLVEQGRPCKIRPHPRWSDMRYIEEVFANSGIDIEDPRVIPTRDSIAETEIVVGAYSTVIAEAYYGGRKIAIDDLSDPELFENLKRVKYIMFNKEHMLLSDIV